MTAKTKPSGKVKSMEQQPADISEAMESAQARAGMYNFLANLFNQRPDLELGDDCARWAPKVSMKG